MIRKTISLPDRLAKDIEKVARKERMSFSGTIARLVDEALRRRRSPYRCIGVADSGPPDLGTNAEKYLAGIFEEWRD